MPKIGEEERRLVEARMAMQEVAALTNKAVETTQFRDKVLARSRIGRLRHGDADGWRKDRSVRRRVDARLDAAVARLRDANLNINFKAQEFFGDTKWGDKYTTKFETMRPTGAPMGDTRNDVEMKMFRYAEKLGIKRKKASKGEICAYRRIERYADLTSDDFRGLVRPRYCSVNYPDLIDGMGAQWGRSHFVLADWLKPNMTFIHTDSFDDVSSARDVMAKCANDGAHVQGTKMATYHAMRRLVANMSDPMLSLLIDVVDGKFTKGQTCAAAKTAYRLGSTSYVEGHVHAEMPFASAFRKVRICKAEADAEKSVRKNVRKFLDKFDVEVEFF